MVNLHPRGHNIAPERKGIPSHPDEATAQMFSITFKQALYSCTYLFYDINVWRNVKFNFNLLSYVQLYFSGLYRVESVANELLKNLN